MSQLGAGSRAAGGAGLGLGTSGCCIVVSQSRTRGRAAGLTGLRRGTGGCCIAVTHGRAAGCAAGGTGLGCGAGGSLPLMGVGDNRGRIRIRCTLYTNERISCCSLYTAGNHGELNCRTTGNITEHLEGNGNDQVAIFKQT